MKYIFAGTFLILLMFVAIVFNKGCEHTRCDVACHHSLENFSRISHILQEEFGTVFPPINDINRIVVYHAQGSDVIGGVLFVHVIVDSLRSHHASTRDNSLENESDRVLGSPSERDYYPEWISEICNSQDLEWKALQNNTEIDYRLYAVDHLDGSIIIYLEDFGTLPLPAALSNELSKLEYCRDDYTWNVGGDWVEFVTVTTQR